ncbi:PhoH family protein [Thiopseudomonas alkaliphila]|uniref:PhoH family protein n=1 Tax=Thiopseudomonas alkaliphila TaxID=1697053 RepID=A0AAW7DND4_9GAMM|nr:PhoH family protein [Thiopseudomonas alkaliphila]MDM1695602.1 PhoH family protein [Thiopseudomonas alkaliphila]
MIKKTMASGLKLYVLDTNVLIHDPSALLNFQEHHVVIPMTVLEELDHLKSGKPTVAVECRQAIRLIDQLLGAASTEQVEQGVPIMRVDGTAKGYLSIAMRSIDDSSTHLPESINDNRIINLLDVLQTEHPELSVVLVSKDINMRLKARACGIAAEDYESGKVIDDIGLLPQGFIEIEQSFWDNVTKVETTQQLGSTWHEVVLPTEFPALHLNQFILDQQGFVGWVKEIIGTNTVRLLDLPRQALMEQQAWGLKPRDIYQALALFALLEPDIDLVNLTGAAGSGKTILALAAAIEQTMAEKRYRRIIATRSVQGLDEDIGFLPGTETEKMEPWLGAITDNLEALHMDDESPKGSVEYILERIPLHFKSLNYIRGRSFQQAFLLIDECQNLTPHQVKTIITRAGKGTKVVCLGNLAQIDTPYLSATSSGLTYLTERLKNYMGNVHITLQGVPRSDLAEYAEAHL